MRARFTVPEVISYRNFIDEFIDGINAMCN